MTDLYSTVVGGIIGIIGTIAGIIIQQYYHNKMAKLNFWYQYQKDIVISVLIMLEELKSNFDYLLNDDDPEGHLLFASKKLNNFTKELLKLKFILPDFSKEIIENLFKISKELKEISLHVYKKEEGYSGDFCCPEKPEIEAKVKQFLGNSKKLEIELMDWIRSNIT